MIELPSREVAKSLEDKLTCCRNQENNPDSEMWVFSCGLQKIKLF